MNIYCCLKSSLYSRYYSIMIGWSHLRGLAPGQHCFEETSQRWGAVSVHFDTMLVGSSRIRTHAVEMIETCNRINLFISSRFFIAMLSHDWVCTFFYMRLTSTSTIAWFVSYCFINVIVYSYRSGLAAESRRSSCSERESL